MIPICLNRFNAHRLRHGLSHHRDRSLELSDEGILKAMK
jgi:hypothetical protein